MSVALGGGALFAVAISVHRWRAEFGSGLRQLAMDIQHLDPEGRAAAKKAWGRRQANTQSAMVLALFVWFALCATLADGLVALVGWSLGIVAYGVLLILPANLYGRWLYTRIANSIPDESSETRTTRPV